MQMFEDAKEILSLQIMNLPGNIFKKKKTPVYQTDVRLFGGAFKA